MYMLCLLYSIFAFVVAFSCVFLTATNFALVVAFSVFVFCSHALDVVLYDDIIIASGWARILGRFGFACDCFSLTWTRVTAI